MNPLYLCRPAASAPRSVIPRQKSGFLRRFLATTLLGGTIALLSAPIAHAQLYTESQTLFGDPTPSEYFGYYVAASGDTVAVSTSSNKRVYVFVHTPTGWVLQQKIAANYSDQSFGRIALDGDTLVAGNEIYVRSGGGIAE